MIFGVINRVARRLGFLVVPCPPSGKMLHEHANVSEVHHSSRGGNTSTWRAGMADSITSLVEQIHDAANEITDMARWQEIADPSDMYLEPRVPDPVKLGRDVGGPWIVLRCRRHDWFFLHFAWGGGGVVDLPDVISEARKHLDSEHTR